MVSFIFQKFELHSIGAGESLLYLNGLAIDMDVYDIFTLLDVMTAEARMVEGLHSLGLKVRNRKLSLFL